MSEKDEMSKVSVASAQASDYANSLPGTAKGLWAKAHAADCSPRQAIKAKCQQCAGYEATVPRVRDCASWRCPLWAFRPYQSGEDATEAME